jgi:hypothetical protein
MTILLIICIAIFASFLGFVGYARFNLEPRARNQILKQLRDANGPVRGFELETDTSLAIKYRVLDNLVKQGVITREARPRRVPANHPAASYSENIYGLNSPEGGSSADLRGR